MDFNFPNTEEEAKVWFPYRRRIAFSPRVLAVATARVEKKWCAYIDAVPGYNHECEFGEVLASGDKLPEDIALAMFPEFEGVPYAR